MRKHRKAQTLHWLKPAGPKVSMMEARIDNLFDNTSYLAQSRADCRDATDRSAYDAFVDAGGETICMGKVIVSQPRWSEPDRKGKK